jgi:RNA polymerase sigma-70 factor (ECF subfamily)
MMVRFRNQPGEASLLAEAIAGSTKAFLQLVRPYDGAVLSLAMRVAGHGEQARQIYGKVFLQLHRELGFLKPGSLGKQIYRLAALACLQHLQQAAFSNIDGAASTEPVEQALRTIMPRDRVIFELRHYEQLDLEEVSNVLDISPTVARAAFARTAARLGRALAPTTDKLPCKEF